jgi:hypothetical protein
VTITDFFRQPRINSFFCIEWVEAPLSLRKFIQSLGGTKATLPQVLEILLRRLTQMPAADCRTLADRQVILACQAFAANTIFAKANLHNLRIGLWNPLSLYYPGELDCEDFLQVSLLLVSEPHKRSDAPLNIFQGFDLKRCKKWDTTIDVFQAGKHPLQIWLKKKHRLCLTDRIREQEGLRNFLRTNYGLLKRVSAIKLGEALVRAGITQVASLLILHKALHDAVVRKEFHTAAPQEADYQRLHALHQKYLVNKQEPICSLAETKGRLELLGKCIRNYGCGRVQSLNTIINENGGELLDWISNDRYPDPLGVLIDQERQVESEQLKIQVQKQLMTFSATQLEMLCLNSLNYNDSEVSAIHQVASCTTKRRRLQLIRKIFGAGTLSDDFMSIEAAYMGLINDYFVTEIMIIRHEFGRQLQDCSKIMVETVKAINQYWGIGLVLNDRLKYSLEMLFNEEGVA